MVNAGLDFDHQHFSACVNYIPIVDAPIEAEVEGAEIPAISHHLHHCLVVQLRDVSEIQTAQVPQLQRIQHTIHTKINNSLSHSLIHTALYFPFNIEKSEKVKKSTIGKLYH